MALAEPLRLFQYFCGMHFQKAFVLVVILIFICTFQLIAQEVSSSRPFSLSYKQGIGFIIPHRTEMQSLSAQHLYRQEIRFEKQGLGQKEWHSRFNYPRVSFALTNYSMQKASSIGEAWAISSGLSFDYLKRKNFRLNLSSQAGLGYIEKPFDPLENYQNIAIGSQFNIYIFIQTEVLFSLSERSELGLGAGVSHFSNNAFKVPNLGYNLPHTFASLSYSLGKKAPISKATFEEFEKEQAYWNMRVAAGLNESYPIGGPKYLASQFSLSRSKRFTPSSTFGGGLDFFYNPAQRASLAVDSIFVKPGFENLQIGLSIHYHLHFGRFGVLTQVGAYVKTEQEEWGRSYQMVLATQKLSPRLTALAGLKTHQVTAEYFLLGLQYNFMRNEQ